MPTVVQLEEAEKLRLTQIEGRLANLEERIDGIEKTLITLASMTVKISYISEEILKSVASPDMSTSTKIILGIPEKQ